MTVICAESHRSDGPAGNATGSAGSGDQAGACRRRLSRAGGSAASQLWRFLTALLVTTLVVTVAVTKPARAGDGSPEPAAQPVQLPEHLSGKTARLTMSFEEPFERQPDGFDYGHEVRVALPASYERYPDRAYPVIWVMDGDLMLHMVVGVLNLLTFGGDVPEMIVVSVGSPPELGIHGHLRRLTNFSPPGDSYYGPGLIGELQREIVQFPEFPHKGDKFQAFLIGSLRDELSERYRMSEEHTLFGHSSGGMFAGYTLFTRPEAFSSYIIGSPYLYAVDGAVFKYEKSYASNHDDLPVSVFIGAGDKEISDSEHIATGGLVSSMALLSERVRLRRYPSLQWTSRIYSGEDHGTVVPRLLMEAIPKLSAAD